MVKENRFEVIEGRNGYLKCEACGASIKSGRLCHNCEQSYHKEVEQAARNERQRNMRETLIIPGSIISACPLQAESMCFC